MIEVTGRAGNAVRFQLTGKVTDEDYENVLIPAVNDTLSEHDKVNCLIEFGEEYERFELGAMWEDTKFGVKHAKDFGKVAVVGASRWVEWGTKVGNKLTSTELKTFPTDQADSAWNWVSE